MIYYNPIIKGFYPDPSVCAANGKYYLVASSFQYFPGVPLFESKDLVNWEQIGYCLTRTSQLPLNNVPASCGIYAPTIRCNNGRFYMVTTNVGHPSGGNFYVWTDNIYGEWSEPIFVEQDGIDPSLYFEDNKAFFMSNGTDADGRGAILQCEIDISNGKKLTESRILWHGAGGRYLEAPHLYKINSFYYLMAAEGGTEYGHMITYARSRNLWGTFEPYPKNPVLTNRNLGGYELQGIGHGDLVQDGSGNWWMFSLGFRQIGKWLQFHHLGREVCLSPVTFGTDGWFTAGDGTVSLKIETDRISTKVEQQSKVKQYNFGNMDKEWRFLRTNSTENYVTGKDYIKICSACDTLDIPGGTPAFVGFHQKDFDFTLSVNVRAFSGEAGISLYMDENHHYDLTVAKYSEEYKVVLRLNIGDIKYEKTVIPIDSNSCTLLINANAEEYTFGYACQDKKIFFATAKTKYLSSEVAGGFTGVVIGLYSQFGKDFNEYSNLSFKYI